MLPNMRVDNNKGVSATSWFTDGLGRVLPWANTLNKTAESSSNELSKFRATNFRDFETLTCEPPAMFEVELLNRHALEHLDVAYGGVTGEKAPLEFEPSMMVVARGFDRTRSESTSIACTSKVRPPHFIGGQSQEELRRTVLDCSCH